MTYGKVKLILKQNRYFIESRHEDVVKMLLNDPVVRPIVINQDMASIQESLAPKTGSVLDFIPGPDGMTDGSNGNVPKDIFEFYDKMDQDEETNGSGNPKKKLFLLEILKDQIEVLQKR